MSVTYSFSSNSEMRHALLILFLLSMAGPKLPGADAPQPSEADARREAVVTIQRIEWQTLFEYCLREAAGQ